MTDVWDSAVYMNTEGNLSEITKELSNAKQIEWKCNRLGTRLI